VVTEGGRTGAADDRRSLDMGNIIVTQFVTLDGVVSDPDGRCGVHGGWAFHRDRAGEPR
jgi:hypothetical protein